MNRPSLAHRHPVTPLSVGTDRRLALIPSTPPAVKPTVVTGTVTRITDLPPQRPSSATVWHRIRPWLQATAIGLGVAALGALIWIIVLAILALIALVTTILTAIATAISWVISHLLLIVVIVVALVFLGAKSGACPGLHCRGCKH